MTTMTMTMMATGAAILLVATVADLLLGKASSSLRHLVWTSALAALLLVPLVDASGVRVELPVPAEWLDRVRDDSPGAVGSAVPAPTPRRDVASGSASAHDEVAPHGTARAGHRHAAASSASAAGWRAESRPSSDVAADGLGTSSASGYGASSGLRARSSRGDGAAGGSGASFGSGDESADGGGPSSERAAAPLLSGQADHDARAGAGKEMTTGIGIDGAMVLASIWLLGALVLLSATLFAQLAAQRATVKAVRPVHPRVRDRLAALAYEVGLRRPVRLVVSRELPVPATWGLMSSTIVLPEQHRAWSADTLDRVLLHELAHVRRRDCWTLLVGELARAVHWPNPLAWLAVRRQRFESERACDDRVLARGDAPSDYATDLVGMARSLIVPDPTPRAVLAMAGPVGVPARVRSILQPGRSRRRVGALGSALAAAATFGVGFTIAGVVPIAHAQEEPTDEGAWTPQPVDPVAPIGPVDPLDPIPSIDPSEPIAPLEPLPALDALEPAPGGWSATPSLRWVDAPAPDLPLPERRLLAVSFASTVAVGARVQERCRFADSGRRSTSISSDEDEYRIRWETDTCQVEVDMEGRITFRPDDTGIAEMANGAILDIEERVGRSTRRARLEGFGSSIERDYWVDGDRVGWNADADRWLAALLPELFRHTTINAEARVLRFLREGGTAAVFAEVDLMRSDHVRRVYLSHLIEHADLGQAEYVRIIDIAGSFDSDHSTTELLLSIVAERGLLPAFQDPILRATAGIDSDHQKGRLLGALLESNLSPEQMDVVLQTAHSIDSDHQLGTLLSQVARDGGLTAAGRASFMSALASIESDHQQATVLGTFLDQGSLTADELSQVLVMMEGIESDHQRATVLQRVAQEYPLTDRQVTAFLDAAAGIESDHQLASTATLIVRRADFTSEHVALVLAMADRVESDHQTGTILAAVIERRALTPGEIDGVLIAARQVGSDHQLAQILVQLIDDEELGDDGVLGVLDVARTIGSDHQQSTVLVRLAERHDIDGEALGLYRDMAERMSKHQRDQTLAAIARRPRR